MPVNATTGIGGVALGFHPATATDATLTVRRSLRPIMLTRQTVTMQVNTTAPIWMFCGQTGHCGQGMVFSINAPATGNTFDAYLTNAKATASGTTGTTGTAGTAGTSAGAGGASGAASAGGAAATGTVPNASTGTTSTTGGASALGLGAGALVAVLASALALLA